MQKEYKGYTITIDTDENPENPIKNWDMLGTFSCFHRRYDLGNDEEHSNPDELAEFFESTPHIKLPIYMYDHSGVTISTKPFSCPWDSGKLGYIWVTKEKARKEYGRLTKRVIEQINKNLVAEVAVYEKYLSGSVLYYSIEDANGEIVDSCYGFFDDEDYVLSEATGIVDNRIEEENQNEKECAAIMAL